MSRTVLVVDDDRSIREVLELALIDEGYEVLLAGDGLEALRRLAERPPDLVVLDGVMPRLDGAGFAAELGRRGLRPAIPLLLLTADGQAQSAAAIAPEVRVGKPFDVEALLRAVERLTAPAPGPGR